MKTKPSLWQMVLLAMFPQIAETIYSPTLDSISKSFDVSYTQAAQTLSVYFSVFALGVVVWGVLADKWGRRPTMLLGLGLFASSAVIAMQTNSFTWLMIARVMGAFGLAVGSVVTQTMLRDAFSGPELAKVFGYMGMGLSISPIIGLLLGAQLSEAGGHQYVFTALLIMVLALIAHSLWSLPETQQSKQPLHLKSLGIRMVKDGSIWISALLVASFNIALFSYYQLGSFTFLQLGFSIEQFGYSGVVLGFGTLLGSLVNKSLLKRQVSSTSLIGLAAGLQTLGAVGVYFSQDTIWFLLPMVLVVMAFGIAIPNVLSRALVLYQSQAGSAGALLGLMYYTLIGSGLALAGMIQDLGVVLVLCGALSVLVAIRSRL
ncbi:multidrug effflux MFS transporter [Vibrio gigantis]|uniref:Multidrug effflux MFS transporter n=1 Tax=Vibrio gigantis TaxID=296199 RepID=A0A5M9P6C5_9VIBR|nr:multidrug effflux MFS transporter [Vibrio gigantis]KAA8681284.1 multidrug effflux MFS transporter [Vibrio gigantis]ULN66656.1 multidrug effflux MFS transporter [Vibrio gigantis]